MGPSLSKTSTRFLIAILAFLLMVVPLAAAATPQANASASPSPAANVSPGNTSPQATDNQNEAAGTAPNLPPGPGCYQQASSGAWQPIACGNAPAVPQVPPTGAAAQETGNGYDYQATSGGTIVGSSTGSFGTITGLTSEVGGQASPFNNACLSGDGTPDCYSLQLNTETFTCNTPYTNGLSINCWEQFVYSNGSGELYIQYWLLNYCTVSGGSNCGDTAPFTSSNPAPSFSCPSTAPPGGWGTSGGSCYGDSSMVTGLSSVPATSLGSLSLYAYANVGGSGMDVIKLCGSGPCSMVAIADGVLDLFTTWTTSEFNVFGDAGGSQAVFNAGTSITVQNALTDESGSPITASCLPGGTTGESTNLFLGPCTASGSGISFTEASESFTISATPSDATVLAGQTGDYSVTLTLLCTNKWYTDCGTAAPVALSVVSGLPSGAVASFGTNPLTPTGSTTLSITTTSATLGDYALTIQGQFGLIIETTTVNLHIYDFTISLPSDETVLRGQSAVYYPLNLALDPGSSTIGIPAVTLSVSGGPSDASFVFSETSVTPVLGGCSILIIGSCQTLTVTTAGAPSGSLGDFTFKVIGTDPDPSGGSRSSSANLHIYDFSVGLSPSDQTVIRGQSAAYDLTLILVAGSTTTGLPAIGLSVSGLPSDATSSFSASSITPTFAGCSTSTPADCQTLTVTTAGPLSGSLGDFTFKVTGTDPSLSGGSRSSTANLHIFDFSVTLSPSTEILPQGSTITMTVSVGLVPGSSSVALPPVSLTLTGLPVGVTETGFPSSLSIGSSQTFTLQTSGVGSYVSCSQVSNKGGQNLKDEDLAHCDLAGYNLQGDNLMGANLQYANLQNANLAGANLMGANLASANTGGADFQGANMKGVDISSATPLGTFTLTATGTTLGVSRIGTSMLTVLGDSLAGDNFQGTNLMGANLSGDLATGADFQGANMMTTDLQGGVFVNADFQGVNLMNSNLSNGDFNGANFSGANTNGTDITGATFVGATNPP